MPNLDLVTLLGLLFRQGLAMGGGVLVAHGVASADQATSIEGGLLALFAIGLSAYQKHSAANKLAASAAPKT